MLGDTVHLAKGLSSLKTLDLPELDPENKEEKAEDTAFTAEVSKGDNEGPVYTSKLWVQNTASPSTLYGLLLNMSNY